jgi:hypothetical protein
MKNRKQLLGTATGLLLLAGVLAALLPRLQDAAPRADEVAYERIRLGMTREEISSVIGGPPGDYMGEGYDVLACWHDHDIGIDPDDDLAHPRWQDIPEEWDTTRGAILVRFDQQGRATAKDFARVVPDDTGWFSRLKALVRF